MDKYLIKRSGTYKAFVIPAPVDLDLTYVITVAGEYVVTASGAYVVVDYAIAKFKLPSIVERVIRYIARVGKAFINRNSVDKNIVHKSKIYKY